MKRIFAHIGFSFAITLIVLCLLSVKISLCITLGLAILFVASLCLGYFRRNISFPLCFGSAFVAGVIFVVVTTCVVAPQLELSGERADISFYITDVEDVDNDGNYAYTVKTSSIDIDGAPQHIKMRMKSPSSLMTDCYHIINARVSIRSIAEKPYESFGYWSDGIYLSGNIQYFDSTDTVVHSPLRPITIVRERIIAAFQTILTTDEAGIATALVTGIKKDISRRVKSYFMYSGASHILAVSGLHLTVVAGVLYNLLRRLRVNQYVTSSVTSAIILLYIAIAGFSSSVVRAGVMMLVMILAPLFRSYADSLNSLGLALFLICLNPYAVTDVGTLLSVIATLAMLLSSAYILSDNVTFDDKLSKRIFVRGYNEITSIFVFAFVLLLSLPVLYVYYGYVTIASLLSNVLLVPLGSLSLVFSIVTLGAYGVGINAATAFFARILQIVIDAMISLARFISSFNNTTISLGKDFVVVIIGAMIIIAVCFIFNNVVLLKRGIIISTVFLLVAGVTMSVINSNNSYIYITKDCAVVAYDNDSVIVSNIHNESDFYAVVEYLNSINKTIDILVDNGDVNYSVALTQSIYTDTVVTSELDENMLDNGCYNNIVVQDQYNAQLGDNMTLFYDKRDYQLSVDDVTFSSVYDKRSNADIILYNNEKTVVDTKGVAYTENGNGELVYTIRDNGFSARRIV